MERLMNKEKFRPRYLGDGLYAAFDGYQFWLLAFNGIEITNEVALDQETMMSFLGYVENTTGVEIVVNKLPVQESLENQLNLAEI